ncbi:MAG: translocation/assembly module TamB domain-containing protein, partial [Acetobacteraceae bacterium]|nr:translocation/assembly module TamB domain-containing protein [Acetobacteraceae bacterium]
VFIRGRGMNVELGGAIAISGTTKAMQPRGMLKLRRGTFNLVGNTLTFNSGDIDFNGGSLTNPGIHLVAMSTVNGTVATLTVSGTARNPKITLTSQPELPQDQILALLLFHTSSDRLSPFQLASIAGGLAEISGTSSGLTNPLQSVQNALGLDQLGVGGGPNGNPSLQAGRYVGRRLYVGAQESTGGQGAQGVVTYDLTHGLKLNATVGTGQTTSAIGATGEANGASVGITYSFEY